MKGEGHLLRPVNGFLAGVCLLLLASNLVLDFWVSREPDLRTGGLPPSSPIPQTIPSPALRSPNRSTGPNKEKFVGLPDGLQSGGKELSSQGHEYSYTRSLESRGLGRKPLQPRERQGFASGEPAGLPSTRLVSAIDGARHTDSPYHPPTTMAMVAATVEQGSLQATVVERRYTTIKPLGYVEKTNGRSEAIVADGDHVALVHEGELFAGRFRVLKVSPSAVELIDESAEREKLRAAPVIASGPTLSLEPRSTPRDKVAKEAANQSVGGQSNVVQGGLGPTREKPVSGEAMPGVGTQVSAGRREAPGLLKEQGRIQDSPLQDSAQTFSSSSVLSQEPMATLARGIKFDQAYNPPRSPPLNQTQLDPSGSERLGVKQAGGRPAGPTESPPDSAPSQAGPQTRSGSTGVIVSHPAARRDHGPAESARGTKRSYKAFKPLGYVEMADGEIEAVLADGEHVALVREGEVFAERYRVLRVSALAVEVLEESDEVAARNASRGPGKSTVFANGPPASVPMRPNSHSPPARAAESIPPGGVQGYFETNRVESALDVGGSARRKDLSGSAIEERNHRLVAPLGYVEWMGGQIEAIVAEGDRVSLVREEEIFSGKSRVRNLIASAMELAYELFRLSWQPPSYQGNLKLAMFGAPPKSAPLRSGDLRGRAGVEVVSHGDVEFGGISPLLPVPAKARGPSREDKTGETTKANQTPFSQSALAVAAGSKKVSPQR